MTSVKTSYAPNTPVDGSTVENTLFNDLNDGQLKLKLVHTLRVEGFKDMQQAMPGGTFAECSCTARALTTEKCWNNHYSLIEFNEDKLYKFPIEIHLCFHMDPRSPDGKQVVCPRAQDRVNVGEPLTGCNIMMKHGKPNWPVVATELQEARDQWKAPKGTLNTDVVQLEVGNPKDECYMCQGKKHKKLGVGFEIGHDSSSEDEDKSIMQILDMTGKPL